MRAKFERSPKEEKIKSVHIYASYFQLVLFAAHILAVFLYTYSEICQNNVALLTPHGDGIHARIWRPNLFFRKFCYSKWVFFSRLFVRKAYIVWSILFLGIVGKIKS